MDDFITRVPVNRTAAKTTSQYGCDTELTLEQQRDNLVSKVKSLKLEIKKFKRGSFERNHIGMEIQVVQEKINKLRPKLKAKGVQQFIIDIIREDFTKYEWDCLMRKAIKRRRMTDEECGE